MPLTLPPCFRALPHLDARTQATFVVEIDAPSDMTVLSNAPAAATRWILSSADSSVSRVTFQPTPVMSTYLLSIAVGHLKAATAHSSRRVSQLAWHLVILPPIAAKLQCDK